MRVCVYPDSNGLWEFQGWIKTIANRKMENQNKTKQSQFTERSRARFSKANTCNGEVVVKSGAIHDEERIKHR